MYRTQNDTEPDGAQLCSWPSGGGCRKIKGSESSSSTWLVQGQSGICDTRSQNHNNGKKANPTESDLPSGNFPGGRSHNSTPCRDFGLGCILSKRPYFCFYFRESKKKTFTTKHIKYTSRDGCCSSRPSVKLQGTPSTLSRLEVKRLYSGLKTKIERGDVTGQ